MSGSSTRVVSFGMLAGARLSKLLPGRLPGDRPFLFAGGVHHALMCDNHAVVYGIGYGNVRSQPSFNAEWITGLRVLGMVNDPSPTRRLVGFSAGRVHSALHVRDVGKPDEILLWGSSPHGQCADDVAVREGTAKNDAGGRLVLGGADREIAQVACGLDHTVALGSSGAVYTWGWNADGQLGLSAGGSKRAPGERQRVERQPRAVAGVAGATHVATSGDFTLALTARGDVLAWGNSEYAQCFAVADRAPAVAQMSAPAAMARPVGIAAGYAFGLVLDEDGAVWRWGAGAAVGSAAPLATPTRIGGLPPIARIAASGQHAVMVARDGSGVFGIGSNADGKLGLSADIDSTAEPKEIFVAGAAEEIAQVALGRTFTIISTTSAAAQA